MCLAALAIFMLSLASTLTQTRQQQDVQFSMTETPADRLNIGDKVTVNLTLTGVVTTTNLQLRIRTHRYISVIGAKATVDCFSSYICTGVAFPYTANHIAQLTIDEVETQILSVQKFYTKWTVAVQLILQHTRTCSE
ncbi:PREDICTED: uncharacterized protein LOC106805651 [Priapulus caudatus]|uniref:Uncharacterized protein LOC106805651 n=1 Tax=Priapulus caudatus TaxID=37621 RepID=A0ABM1DSA3_PRICU|nr:PREDICTED: uncharacterized protein LOC106805651 [Priapulus caudatus]